MSVGITWIVPVGYNLAEVMEASVIATCDANVQSGVNPNQPVDKSKPLRSDASVVKAVQRIREAITKGARVPLSLTTGSVPPGAYQHCLYLAGQILTAAKPNMQQVVMGPNGNISPFYVEYQKAEKWLDDIASGKYAPEYPIDPTPTGVTGTDGYPVQFGIKFGDLYGSDAQYAAGTQIDGAPYPMTTST